MAALVARDTTVPARLALAADLATLGGDTAARRVGVGVGRSVAARCWEHTHHQQKKRASHKGTPSLEFCDTVRLMV